MNVAAESIKEEVEEDVGKEDNKTIVNENE